MQIPTHTLRSIFAPLAKVIPSRANLPVLAYLHFQRRGHEVIVSATDLDCWLSVTIEAEPAPITSLGRMMAEIRWKRDAKPILVPWMVLRSALKSAAGAQLVLEPDAITYELEGQPIRVPFEAPPVDEFPSAPEVHIDAWATLEASDRGAILAANDYASTDETRYIINGVLCEHHPEPCVVATDGRRLYRRTLPALAALDHSFVLPRDTLYVLSAPAILSHRWNMGVPGKQEGVGEQAEYAVIDAGPWRLVSKTQEGNYPNYRQVIPLIGDRQIVAISEPQQAQLLRVISHLPSAGALDAKLNLSFQADHLTIADPASKASVAIPGIRCLKPIAITLNHHYFRDTIRLGPGTLYLEDEMAPILYHPQGAEVVVMPMRVS